MLGFGFCIGEGGRGLVVMRRLERGIGDGVN